MRLFLPCGVQSPQTRMRMVSIRPQLFVIGVSGLLLGFLWGMALSPSAFAVQEKKIIAMAFPCGVFRPGTHT